MQYIEVFAAIVADGSIAVRRLPASGPKSAFERVLPYLKTITTSVTYAGAAEEALLINLSYNLLLGVMAQALAEATALAERAGCPGRRTWISSTARCLVRPSSVNKGRLMRSGDYEPTFSAEDLREDFDLGLGAARALEVPMPIAATTYEAIQVAIGHAASRRHCRAISLRCTPMSKSTGTPRTGAGKNQKSSAATLVGRRDHPLVEDRINFIVGSVPLGEPETLGLLHHDLVGVRIILEQRHGFADVLLERHPARIEPPPAL